MNVLSPCQLFTFFSINFRLKKRKYNRQITKKINTAEQLMKHSVLLYLTILQRFYLTDQFLQNKNENKNQRKSAFDMKRTN